MSRVLPILFNTEMVGAILGGRKKVTRRIVKGYIPDDAIWGYSAFSPKGYISCRGIFADGYGEKFFKRPYQPGDILYARETWQYLYELDGNEQIIEGTGKYYYAASGTLPDGTYIDSASRTHERIPWRPSIHMPKEAARIWLKVTDVRVERLRDITWQQAADEGCYGSTSDEPDPLFHLPTLRGEFKKLWDSTLKKSDLDRYGWDANPWVWVIEFERCEKPESEK